MIDGMAENQPQTAPTVSFENAEDFSALETVASLLHAATSAAAALRFGPDQSYLALGLELAYAEAIALLPSSSEVSPTVYAAREAMLARAAEAVAADSAAPSVGVAMLLSEASDILANPRAGTGLSELATNVDALHQEAKRGAFLPRS